MKAFRLIGCSVCRRCGFYEREDAQSRKARVGRRALRGMLRGGVLWSRCYRCSTRSYSPVNVDWTLSRGTGWGT